MATLRKRGKAWRVEIRKAGVRDDASFDTKAEAVAWATKREFEISAGKRGVILHHSLREAFKRYKDTVSPTKKGARWEAVRLEKFEREIKFVDRVISEIKPNDIAGFRDGRLKCVKGASVRREMNLLKSVFEIARKEWGWLETNPMTDVRRPPPSKHRDRIITNDEQKAMLESLGYVIGATPDNSQHIVAMVFLFALETGMRAGEIIPLDWADVSLSGRFATLPETKNGERRSVPLSRAAVALLELMPHRTGEVFQINSGLLDALFRKARAKAKLSGFKFHDTRHTACTALARKLGVLDLSKMIGHRDLKSLGIYYNPTATEIAARLD